MIIHKASDGLIVLAFSGFRKTFRQVCIGGEAVL